MKNLALRVLAVSFKIPYKENPFNLVQGNTDQTTLIFKKFDAVSTQVDPGIDVTTNDAFVQFSDHYFLAGRRKTMLHGCNLSESLEYLLNVAWPYKFLCASIGSDLVVSSISAVDKNGNVETLP